MPYVSTFSAKSALSAEDEAYQHLLNGICQGGYATGERLIAEDIASELGMSRMPVRGAFKRLASEGLVTLRPNRGAVVSGLDLQQMREVFEMRGALEGLAIRLATAQLNERHLARLERLLDEMDECREDSAEWVSRHRLFHEYLCSLSGRPRLQQHITSLYALIEPYMRMWLQHVDKPLSAREEHSAILDALRSGQALEAERVLVEHIEGTVPSLLDFLESSDA